MRSFKLGIEKFCDSFLLTSCSACGKFTEVSGICSECSAFFEQCLQNNHVFSLDTEKQTVKGISCFPYKENHTRQLILFLKKNRKASTLYYCASIMEKQLANLNICGRILFVSIPRSKSGMSKYGFDQGKALAKAVCELVPNSEYLDIVARKGSSAEQKKLSAQERMFNTVNKFKIKNTRRLSSAPQNIVIIDDVCTTGSSILECARLLFEKFPESRIYALTLAIN